jgi:hypothetical protein
MALPLPASAQRITALGLPGIVRSASAAVEGESQATVFTTPADRPFVLTQACFDAGGMVLSGSTFGVIPGEMGACTTYHPGISLPRNENLVCQNPNGVVGNCMITGVVTR